MPKSSPTSNTERDVLGDFDPLSEGLDSTFPLLGNDVVQGRLTAGGGGRAQDRERIARRLVELVASGATPSEAAARLGLATSRMWQWVRRYPLFAAALARARRAGAHARVDALLEMVRDDSRDIVAITDSNGRTRYVSNGAAVARHRLIVETEMRVLSALDPDTWGQRTTTVHEDRRPEYEVQARLLALLEQAATTEAARRRFRAEREQLAQAIARLQRGQSQHIHIDAEPITDTADDSGEDASGE